MKWLCNSKKKHIILTQFCVQPPPKKKTHTTLPCFFGSNPPQKKNLMLGNCQFPLWKMEAPGGGGKKQPIHHGQHRPGLTRSFSQVATPTGPGQHLAEGAAVEMIGWCGVIFFGRNDENPRDFVSGLKNTWGLNIDETRVFWTFRFFQCPHVRPALHLHRGSAIACISSASRFTKTCHALRIFFERAIKLLY